MPGIALRFAALFSGVFLLFVGNGLFINSAGFELTARGVGPSLIGLINACFFLGAALSTLSAQLLISRVGHARSYTAFASAFAAGALLHDLTANLWLWAALRVAQGFAYYGLLMVIESWLSERADSGNRSRMLACYEITFYVSFGLGFFLIGLGLGGFKVFLLSAVFVTLGVIPIAVTKLAEPKIPPKEKISFPAFGGISALALSGAMFGGLMMNGFFTMSSVFMLSQGFSAAVASKFSLFGLLGGFCVQWPAGKLSDKFGRRPALIAVTSVAVAASLSGFFYRGANPAALNAMAFFIGFGVFSIYSLSLARAVDESAFSELNVVQVSRAILFAYGVGSLLSPFVLGYAMETFGPSGFTSLYAAGSLAVWLMALRNRTVPKDFRSSYVHAPAPGAALTGNDDLLADPPPDAPDRMTLEESARIEKAKSERGLGANADNNTPPPAASRQDDSEERTAQGDATPAKAESDGPAPEARVKRDETKPDSGV